MSGAPAPAPAAPPTAIPAGLKRADITRFAHRAAQLQNFRPVISYWCRYHILEQILAAKLHTQDEECLQYTTALMDELESFKAQNAQNDAVTDDVASQAYVEQFAHETFNRAETAMRADKATVTTADTFQAAATFFELLSIWGTPDPEIAAKVKFAKYHALRIARALKAGEDPNLTNPKPAVDNKEDEAENGEQDGQAAVHLSAEDPDVQAIMGPPQVPSTTLPLRGAAAAAAAQDSSAQGKPTSGGSGGGDSDTASGAGGATPPVRLPGVMDIDEPHPAQSKNMERKPSAGIIPDLPAAPSEFATPTVSPGPTSGRDAGGRAAPLTGMPSIINPLNDNTTEKLQQAASGGAQGSAPLPAPPTSMTPPNVPSASAPKSLPRNLAAAPADQRLPSSSPLSQPPTSLGTPSPSEAAVNPAVPVSAIPRPSISATSGLPTASGGPTSAAAPAPGTPSTTRSPVPPPSLPSGPAETMDVDDTHIAEAQKHARWAVSALQFDDVPTAIKELKIALGNLGVQ